MTDPFFWDKVKEVDKRARPDKTIYLHPRNLSVNPNIRDTPDGRDSLPFDGESLLYYLLFSEVVNQVRYTDSSAVEIAVERYPQATSIRWTQTTFNR